MLRVANLDDEAALDALMKESAAVLFRRFYDEERATSAVRHVPEVDRMLLADGTYFILETGGGCRLRRVEQARPALHG